MKDRVIGDGFLRQNGRLGIRNHVLIVYTSACAKCAAERIAMNFTSQQVQCIGFTRCVKSEFTQRKLACYVEHPNIGAVLVVSNGCEPLDGGRLAAAATRSGKAAEWLVIQKSGGFRRSVEIGIRYTADLLRSLVQTPRRPLLFRDLVIGAECGGSDFTSGIAANPLIGRFYDRMVDLGATVLFEEMYEAIGLKDYLIGRCANEKAVRQVADTYDKFYAYSVKTNQFFITPGNINGGLSTIEEKSLGAVIKSGTRPLQGVVKIGQIPAKPGLWMMDSMTDTENGCGPYISEDATSILLFPTCGTLLNILSSGRGHLVNTPITPLIKITGNALTYANLHDDIDFDASPSIGEAASMESLTDDFFELVAAVAGGQLTKGEALGHLDGFINQECQFTEMNCGGIYHAE